MMKCTDVYRYLFQYALEKLPAGVKADVEAHIKTCPACKDIVTALRNLIPYLPKGRVGEIAHYNIEFPFREVGYSNHGRHIENAGQMNAILEKNGGCIPEGEHWWRFGASKDLTLLGMFDTEGEEIEYIIQESENPRTFVYEVRKLRGIYDPIHWNREVFEDHTGLYCPKQSYEAPNLYTGRISNTFGSDANSGIYVALPKDATNIRIKRGNGVIECGPYQFVYSQRYVLESEALWLEYTYNM